MSLYFKILIVTLLTMLYAVYLFEIHNHLTSPISLLPHKSRKQRRHWFFIFLLSVICAIGIAYIIRQFLLPKPIFDLIVVSLEAIFIIPFFGAIFTDLLLHAWRQQRLPYAISLLNIIISALIGILTNILILFGSQETMQSVTYVLNVATDITTVCLILVLGILGLAYLQSTKK